MPMTEVIGRGASKKTMLISLTEFPRYVGIRELIPGHVYLDNNGVELLFLGRGKYYREDRYGGWSAPSDVSFLYMKTEDLNAKITKGQLSPDLKVFDPLGSNKPDFWKTVFYSQKPRKLMIDHGERFPANFFKHLVVKDLSGNYYSFGAKPPYFWHIETKNI